MLLSVSVRTLKTIGGHTMKRYLKIRRNYAILSVISLILPHFKSI